MCVFVCFCLRVCLSILLISSGSLAVHLLEGALQKAKDETEKARLRQVAFPPQAIVLSSPFLFCCLVGLLTHLSINICLSFVHKYLSVQQA